jgi:predicted aspartyl protease
LPFKKTNIVGKVYAAIELLNQGDITMCRHNYIGEEDIRQMTVNMLVDSGSVMLAINEEIQEALGLPIIEYRPSQVADGRRLTLPVAGPIFVRFEGRISITSAIVLPGDNEPLFGAIPMEEMDLWINPNRNILTFVHPEGPVMSLK